MNATTSAIRAIALGVIVVVLGVLLLYAYRSQSPAVMTVPITEAVQNVQAGKVKTVTEIANKATLDLNDGTKVQTNLPDNSKTDPLQDAVTAYNNANPTRQILLRYEEQSATLPFIGSVLLSLLPIVIFVTLIVLLAYVLSRGRAADRYAQLERIANLRDRGVLSEDEFQREKRRLLG